MGKPALHSQRAYSFVCEAGNPIELSRVVVLLSNDFSTARACFSPKKPIMSTNAQTAERSMSANVQMQAVLVR